MVDHLVLPAVLQVIVDHVDPSILQLLLCCIAPVCQAWQAAVANLPSQCIDVALTASKDAASQAWWCTISSFCSWLHHHGGLVRSIDISKSLALDFSAFSCWPLQEALATALIAAAEADSRKSSTAAAAAAPSAQPQDTKGNPTAAGGADNAAVPTSQPFLQLRSYSSDCMGSRCILDALPAAYLTSLQLSLPQHSRSDESLPGCNDLAAAFERLHNLQSLSLSFKLRQALSERCCSSIGSLTKLTQLNLAVELAAPTVAVLQAAMQLLPLQLLQLRCTYESWVGWNLGPLTLLTELQLHVRDVSTPRPRALELPEQLKILTLNAARANLFGAELAGTGPELTWAREWGAEVPCNLTSLQHLQAFSLKTWQPLPNALVQYLTQLTSLQDVSLAYESVWAAISSRQDMGKLKQLQRLRINWANMDSAGAAVVQRGELLQLMACLGALTTLTSLKVNISMPPPSYWLQLGHPAGYLADWLPQIPVFPGYALALGQQPNPVAPLGDSALPAPLQVFSHLTGLTKLQELQVILGPLPGNPAHGVLTAGLVVQLEAGSAQQLSVLTALTSLQLQDLGAAVDDDAAAALAGSLTNLRHLELQGSYVELDATAAALRRLPMLTELQVWEEGE